MANGSGVLQAIGSGLRWAGIGTVIGAIALSVGAHLYVLATDPEVTHDGQYVFLFFPFGTIPIGAIIGVATSG